MKNIRFLERNNMNFRFYCCLNVNSIYGDDETFCDARSRLFRDDCNSTMCTNLKQDAMLNNAIDFVVDVHNETDVWRTSFSETDWPDACNLQFCPNATKQRKWEKQQHMDALDSSIYQFINFIRSSTITAFVTIQTANSLHVNFKTITKPLMQFIQSFIDDCK